MANALKHTAPYAGSWDELQARLSRHGVQVQPSTHQKKDGPQVYGVVFEKDGHRFKGSEVAKEYSASKLQQAFAQYQVQAPALVQHADQTAKAYDAEAVNRQFQEQARQAQERAQEAARQAPQLPQRQQTPDRSRSGGMEM